jgi:hypothetical protein
VVGSRQKPNPFQFLESVDFKDAGLNLANEDQENPSPEAQGGDVQMAASGAAPDVEPEADSAGQVANVRRRAVPRAQPVQQIAPQPQRQPNFFQRLFGHAVRRHSQRSLRLRRGGRSAEPAAAAARQQPLINPQRE